MKELKIDYNAWIPQPQRGRVPLHPPVHRQHDRLRRYALGAEELPPVHEVALRAARRTRRWLRWPFLQLPQ